jgi:hypothetical protein
MSHSYYSQRTGVGPHPNGLPLKDVINLFVRVFDQLSEDGYFHEAFGYECVDAGFVPGTVRDPDLAILLVIRKRDLWPIRAHSPDYTEDDLFDMIEFLFQHVSKPVEGAYHSWNNCGWHWSKFEMSGGRIEFCEKVNVVLEHYERAFELSPNGEILRKPELGFEPLLAAELPTKDPNVRDRVTAAIVKFRKHGSTIDDRRQAVRDLADIFEYLRPQVQTFLTSKDEGDLFNLANNFGIRHHNDRQKTNYEAALWLNWMFYYFLATIHVLVRKMDRAAGEVGAPSPTQSSKP